MVVRGNFSRKDEGVYVVSSKEFDELIIGVRTTPDYILCRFNPVPPETLQEFNELPFPEDRCHYRAISRVMDAAESDETFKLPEEIYIDLAYEQKLLIDRSLLRITRRV